jgi:hypothetical protein
MLIRWRNGESKTWKVANVPSPEDEQLRQPFSELLELKVERTEHVNRIKGLLPRNCPGDEWTDNSFVGFRRIDEQYTACPFYGSRPMTAWLVQHGEEGNRKRVQRLIRLMGLEAIYPQPRLSAAGLGHRIYPYLLREVRIERPVQVWSADITHVPMTSGFMYLASTIDCYRRYGLAWRLSKTLDRSFCLEMLDEALSLGRPAVFNTDQGCSSRPRRSPAGWSRPGWQ